MIYPTELTILFYSIGNWVGDKWMLQTGQTTWIQHRESPLTGSGRRAVSNRKKNIEKQFVNKNWSQNIKYSNIKLKFFSRKPGKWRNAFKKILLFFFGFCPKTFSTGLSKLNFTYTGDYFGAIFFIDREHVDSELINHGEKLCTSWGNDFPTVKYYDGN